MAGQVLIDGPNGPLWCDGLRRYASGRLRFSVINGGWDGALTPEGDVCVDATGGVFPGHRVVWEGKAPFSDMRYNEAIDWILAQVAGGDLKET